MNLAEQFVADICQRTFLSLWSSANPLGKRGKELCDLLVVCDPYILIFSVKHIVISPSGDLALDATRWKTRAVDESVEQIYGAERFIARVDEIVNKDRKSKIALPSKDKRRVFRIAVAIGRENKFAIGQGDYGKGFVHVFDENSFACILQELDTISDIIGYLEAKEALCSLTAVNYYREQDILGSYLINGHELPIGAEEVEFMPDIWDSLMVHPQYIQKKALDRISYLWDNIIEFIIGTHHIADYSNIPDRLKLEEAFRVIVKESRFSRRMLASALDEFIHKAHTHEFPARIFKSELNKGVAYVFMIGSGVDREKRRAYLEMRCFITRGLLQDCPLIIGIATEPFLNGGRYSFDYYSLEMEDWNDEKQKEANEISRVFGLFRETKFQSDSTSEYPAHFDK